jgi:Flp pilus assembly protein TadB
MARERVERGVEAARRLERHVEEIATKLATKDTMTHFVNAGMEIVQAANVAVREMDVPVETKRRMHRAQKEVLLAVRSAIDVVLAELDKEMPAKGAELKKIEIKGVKPAKKRKPT